MPTLCILDGSLLPLSHWGTYLYPSSTHPLGGDIVVNYYMAPWLPLGPSQDLPWLMGAFISILSLNLRLQLILIIKADP